MVEKATKAIVIPCEPARVTWRPKKPVPNRPANNDPSKGAKAIASKSVGDKVDSMIYLPTLVDDQCRQR